MSLDFCSSLLNRSVPAIVIGLSSKASLIDGITSEEGRDIVWKELEDHVHNENSETNSNRQQVLLPGLACGMKREELSSVLDNKEVDNDNDNPDDEESNVVKETLANVNLVMDLPCGDHVDDLKPDEQVEDESHVTTRGAINVLPFITLFLTYIIVYDFIVE